MSIPSSCSRSWPMMTKHSRNLMRLCILLSRYSNLSPPVKCQITFKAALLNRRSRSINPESDSSISCLISFFMKEHSSRMISSEVFFPMPRSLRVLDVNLLSSFHSGPELKMIPDTLFMVPKNRSHAEYHGAL